MSSEGEIIHERGDKIRQEEVWRSKSRVSIVNVSREEEEEENGVNNKKKTVTPAGNMKSSIPEFERRASGKV